MFVKNSRKIHFITLISKGQFDPSGYKKEDQRKLDRTEVGNSQHKENLNVYSSYCHEIRISQGHQEEWERGRARFWQKKMQNWKTFIFLFSLPADFQTFPRPSLLQLFLPT